MITAEILEPELDKPNSNILRMYGASATPIHNDKVIIGKSGDKYTVSFDVKIDDISADGVLYTVRSWALGEDTSSGNGGHSGLSNSNYRVNDALSDGALEGEWFRCDFTFEVTDSVLIKSGFYSQEGRGYSIREIMLNKGTKALPYSPAPEDTEAKITDINTILTSHDTIITQTAEAITSKADKSVVDALSGTVGEHSTTITQTAEEMKRKAETSVVDAINETVENHTLTITETAKDVSSLIEKTDLLDGDITQWSNETQSNAESISQTLTRVEETEAGISQAQTDIQTNADGIAGVIRDVETIDGNLSTLATDFNVEAGKIETLISKTDGHDTQLTNIVADIDGIETIVAANDEWLGTYGSAAEQTIEGFDQKVWLTDVAEINPNLIPQSANAWEDGTFWSSGSNNNNSGGIRTKDYIDVIPGERYTFQDESAYVSAIEEVQIVQWDGDTPIGITDFINRRSSRSFTAQGDRIRIGLTPMSGFGIEPNYVDRLDERIKMKLEKGDSATPFMNALSRVEQQANEVSIKVSELGSINGEEILTESDISVRSDRVLIGSTSIGSETLASIISVSPSAIDMITDELNLTGNLNVSEQIESMAVSAVTGNFAEIFSSTADINFITGNHIQSDSIWSNHIIVSNALVEKIVARSAYFNSVETLSLEAVYADLRKVDSEIMTSNIIKSNWLDVDTALFERFTADEGFISRLTAQTVFARDIETITMDAVQANLTTVMNSMGEVEGGLSIRRPDGAYFVEQGLQKFGQPIQLVEFMDAGVTWNGQWYETTNRGSSTFSSAYTDHSGRYANFAFAVRLSGYSDSASAYMNVVVRRGNVPSGVYVPAMVEERIMVRRGESTGVTINVPLPRPTYGALSFTLEFYREGELHHNNIIQVRPGRAWVSA